MCFLSAFILFDFFFLDHHKLLHISLPVHISLYCSIMCDRPLSHITDILHSLYDQEILHIPS